LNEVVLTDDVAITDIIASAEVGTAFGPEILFIEHGIEPQ